MSKGKKKEKNPQIEVRTFNWGPCVIKLKIQDDFKKVLLDEIKKSKEDYRHKLAGQIEKEMLANSWMTLSADSKFLFDE